MELLVESGVIGEPLGCGCFSAAAWDTELGPSSRQSTEAFRSASSFLVAAYVVRTWNLVICFLYASYLTVTFPVSWCCLWSTELDFPGDPGMLLVRKDLVRQWTHVLHHLRRFWTNGTYFLR